MEEKIKSIRWDEAEPLCVIRRVLHNFWIPILAYLAGSMIVTLLLGSVMNMSYSGSVIYAVVARTGMGYVSNNSYAASEIVESFGLLLSSDALSDVAGDMLGGLEGKITATQLGSTNLLRVDAEASDPQTALKLINSITENYSILSQYVSTYVVLSPLNTPSVAVRQTNVFNTPVIAKYTGLGCAAATVLILVWLALTSGTVQNETGARRNVDAAVIASVPHVRGNLRSLSGRKKRKNMTIAAGTVPFAFGEAVGQIGARLEKEAADRKQVFLFSSVSESEGKSTVAANAAMVLARKGMRVLLVDLDLRRPVQAMIVNAGVPENNEFGRLLSEGATEETLLSAALTEPKTGLHVLLSTKSYPNVSELLASPLLARMIARAREYYDIVIIDSPPVGYFADSEVLSDLADGALMVIRQDLVPAMYLNDAADALASGRASLIGCVLNDMRYLIPSGSESGGYGYGYGKYGYGKYGYGNGSRSGKKA